MTTITREVALNHLFSNSIVDEATGCREWQGSLTRNGYGQLSNEKIYLAFGIKGTHRLMYHLLTNHIYAGRHEQILHSCDNPRCLEPRHLSLGTATDNMRDCVAKGRARRSNGESHYRARLTEDQVRMMKALIAAGERYVDIAPLFGVHPNYVSCVKTGRSWKHV